MPEIAALAPEDLPLPQEVHVAVSPVGAAVQHCVFCSEVYAPLQSLDGSLSFLHFFVFDVDKLIVPARDALHGPGVVRHLSQIKSVIHKSEIFTVLQLEVHAPSEVLESQLRQYFHKQFGLRPNDKLNARRQDSKPLRKFAYTPTLRIELVNLERNDG